MGRLIAEISRKRRDVITFSNNHLLTGASSNFFLNTSCCGDWCAYVSSQIIKPPTGLRHQEHVVWTLMRGVPFFTSSNWLSNVTIVVLSWREPGPRFYLRFIRQRFRRRWWCGTEFVRIPWLTCIIKEIVNGINDWVHVVSSKSNGYWCHCDFVAVCSCAE